jgi:hypothetical protein
MAWRTTIRWWAPSACWYNSRYSCSPLHCVHRLRSTRKASQDERAHEPLWPISFSLSLTSVPFDAFYLIFPPLCGYSFVSYFWGCTFPILVSPLIAKRYLYMPIALLGRNMTLSSLTSRCLRLCLPSLSRALAAWLETLWELPLSFDLSLLHLLRELRLTRPDGFRKL